MNKKYFKIYGNCILVKGEQESMLCDLQQNESIPISNGLIEIINHLNQNKTVNEIKQFYNNESDEGISKFLEYLHEKGYGFYTNEPNNFPQLNLQWEFPYAISNALIELNFKNSKLVQKAIKQLTEIGCHTLELHVDNDIDLLSLRKMLDNTQNSCIRNIHIYWKYYGLNQLDLDELYYCFNTIGFIYIHSVPENICNKSDDYFKSNKIILSSLNYSISINKVSKKNLLLNKQSFCEANSFNLALNRKVSIDKFGNIKNYLLHEKKFGNINIDNLASVIQSNSLQANWNFTKDKDEICKECQFRYMCLDFNDYIYSTRNHTERCDFNPYINKWKGEIGYKPLFN